MINSKTKNFFVGSDSNLGISFQIRTMVWTSPKVSLNGSQLQALNREIHKDVGRTFDAEGGVIGHRMWLPLSRKYETQKREKFGNKKILERTGKLRAMATSGSLDTIQTGSKMILAYRMNGSQKQLIVAAVHMSGRDTNKKRNEGNKASYYGTKAVKGRRSRSHKSRTRMTRYTITTQQVRMADEDPRRGRGSGRMPARQYLRLSKDTLYRIQSAYAQHYALHGIDMKLMNIQVL